MPNEMIERVAKAIINRLKKAAYPTLEIDDCIASYDIIAKAAIQAMREPTEEMIDAGAYDLDMTVKTQYQNMIDAALKE